MWSGQLILAQITSIFRTLLFMLVSIFIFILSIFHLFSVCEVQEDGDLELNAQVGAKK